MEDRVHDEASVLSIERPERRLLGYYAVLSLMAGPFFLVLFLALYLRFRTVRYRFADDGVSMRWGAVRRREINLSYARIQDIHLTSNLFERWLGLARIQIQTASGSHKPEMTIEGMADHDTVRRFLVARMRGARGEREMPGAAVAAADGDWADVVRSLDATTEALHAVRRALQPAAASTASDASGES